MSRPRVPGCWRAGLCPWLPVGRSPCDALLPPAHLLRVGGLPGTAPLRPRPNFPDGGGGVKLEKISKEKGILLLRVPLIRKDMIALARVRVTLMFDFYSLGIPFCRSKLQDAHFCRTSCSLGARAVSVRHGAGTAVRNIPSV